MRHQIGHYRWWLLALLGVVFFLYSPNIGAGFTNWDDQIHVTDNPRVKSLTVNALLDHFRPNTDYMYHPLTMITYTVEWGISGGEPAVFHLTNILLHMLNVVLAFFIVRTFSGSNGTALFVAALFGIHPLNVEAVSWISSRKDLLYAFFFLLGMHLYTVNGTKERSALRMTVVSLVFIAGLLSKPTMVVFPVMLLVIDWWEERPVSRRMMVEKLPLFLSAVGFGIFTMLLSGSDEDAVTIMSLYEPMHQVLLVAYASVFYLGKILLPVELAAMYHYPSVSQGMLPLWYYLAPFVAVVVAAGVMIAFRRWRFVIVGMAIYILPLMLVLQVLPFNNTSLVAERYAYLSTFGILFILVAGGRLLLQRFGGSDPFWRGAAAMALVIVASMYAIGTMVQVSVWRDSISVFSNVIRKDPTIWIAYANRAIDLMKMGRYQEAMADADRAIQLHPTRRGNYAVRANIHYYLKEYRSAVRDFDSAVFSNRVKPYELYNKAASLYYLGDYDSSVAYYGKAIAADPAFARSYLGYGMILLNEKNNPQLSLPYFTSSIERDPENWEPLYFRAAAFLRMNRLAEAMKDMATAIALNPGVARDTLVQRIDTRVRSAVDRMEEIRTGIQDGRSTEALLAELSGIYRMLGDTVRAAQNEPLRRVP